MIQKIIFYYGGLTLTAILFIYLAGRYTQFGGGLSSILEESRMISAQTLQPDSAVEDMRASFNFERFTTQGDPKERWSGLFSSIARGFPQSDLILRIILKRSILSLMFGLFFFGVLCGYLGNNLFAPVFAAVLTATIFAMSNVFPVLGLLASSSFMPSVLFLVVYAALTSYFGTLLGRLIGQRWHAWRTIEE